MFWRWFFYAVWQGALLCSLALITLDTAEEQFGQIGGLSIEGNFIFAALVLIVNVKVLISSYQYTFWFVMTVVLSVGSFFAIFYLFSIIPIMSTYG